MAEGKPPYANIHPMRAIFMIPSRPPPKLSKDTEWSDNFQDFVTKCLTKNPQARPTAEELVNHPFISNAPGLYVLAEIVAESLEMMANRPLDDSDEGEDFEDSGLDTIVRSTLTGFRTKDLKFKNWFNSK